MILLEPLALEWGCQPGRAMRLPTGAPRQSGDQDQQREEGPHSVRARARLTSTRGQSNEPPATAPPTTEAAVENAAT
eukprot:gene3278-2416_t